MNWLIKAQEEIERLTPAAGYNVVGVDGGAPPGEALYLIANYSSEPTAQKAAKIAAAQTGDLTYVYGPKSARKDFDPDELRASDGKWSAEGGGELGPSLKEQATAARREAFKASPFGKSKVAYSGEYPKDFDYDRDHALAEQIRTREKEWNHEMDVAISRGDFDPKEAEKLGWSDNCRKIEPLPKDLYTVTTAASAVIADRLKTRDELGQDNGKGLGGGASDTISFTADPKIAAGIERGIKEMRQVARGEITMPEMVERARTGEDATRPYLEDVKHCYGGTLGDFEAYAAGKIRTEGSDMGAKPPREEWPTSGTEKVPTDPSKWRPVGEPIIPGAKEKIYAKWERDATPEELKDRAVQLYKTVSFSREVAGGPLDPLFFSSDTRALAAVPESEIKTLHYRPEPGAKGYQVSSLGEWRTFTGHAVKRVEDDDE